ncbi:MAG: zinc-binding dehydrogenase [Turicibacter sp.]|nr:zinc-binding dehydrogenase [Turicibacter sp.]
MEWMKSLIVTENKTLAIAEIPKPTITEYEALVKMVACGICNGTDAKIIAGTFKGLEKYPLMLGHEGVGRVEAVGAKVENYKVGDIVLLPFANDASGAHDSGWGAFSEYATVYDAKAGATAGLIDDTHFSWGQSVVPTDIEATSSAMLITLREVLASIRTFGITTDSTVVVYGCGPVGVTFTKFMHLLGVKNLIVVDRLAEKREVALKNGAMLYLNGVEVDVVAEVRKVYPNGVDFVIDAVGHESVVNEGLKLIRDRGDVCVYGVPATTKLSLDFAEAPYNWNVVFQQMPSKKEEGEAHDQVLAWLRSGDVVLADYISHVMPFEEVLEAFAMLERREIPLKCIVRF